MNTEEMAKRNSICTVMEGSHAYGTSTPESDVDKRGIFCADPINIRTPFFPVKEVVEEEEEDTKHYELSHFMNLLIDQNPNILQLLWVREEDVLETSPEYEYLRSHREEFLSSKIAFTTSGYAHAQLKRIKGHKKWIMNPQPEEPPHQKDYMSLTQWFGEEKVLPAGFNILDFENNHRFVSYGNNLYGLYKSEGTTLFRPDGSIKDNFEGNRNTLPLPLGLIKFNKEQHLNDKDVHANYWNWKNNRNKKRAAIEEEHGIDLKHAMHLVRLMRMGYETLTTCEVLVYRPDAEELLNIRNGSMSYEELLAYADEMDAKIKKAYTKTKLPKRVDKALAAKRTLKIQDMVWSRT